MRELISDREGLFLTEVRTERDSISLVWGEEVACSPTPSAVLTVSESLLKALQRPLPLR